MSLPIAQQVATKTLSERQEKLLTKFFNSKGKKELYQCAKEAGYGVRDIKAAIRSVKDEIIAITEMMLIESAPLAALEIAKILKSDERVPNVNAKLDAAKTILDRSGLGKQDKVSVDVNHTGGIFVLPAKKAVQAPIEAEFKEEV